MHLRLMLVRELQRIGAVGTGEAMVAAPPFHHVDELPPAAAVALHPLNRYRVICRQQPGIDQWADQPDSRRGVAPRYGNEARVADRRRLRRRQFRKAVDPASADAMRRAAVEDA